MPKRNIMLYNALSIFSLQWTITSFLMKYFDFSPYRDFQENFVIFFVYNILGNYLIMNKNFKLTSFVSFFKYLSFCLYKAYINVDVWS